LHHCLAAPEAARPAAVAKNQAASNGGASVSDRDADDACSAAGVDSCGSEDSGSDVLVGLGVLSNGGMDISSSNVVEDQKLLHTYTCLPQQVSEPSGHVIDADMSRCPSTTGSVAGFGVGAVGLESAGCSAASAAVDAVAIRSGCSGSKSTAGVSGRGKQAGELQECSATAAGKAPATVRAGSSQQSGQSDADRSFSHVLDSAWWGRRRR
jgi:hypothetical protein